VDSHDLDQLDHQLVQALQLDARAPFSRIAAVLDVSDQTVARRYRRLHADFGLRVLGLTDGVRLGRTRWMLRLRCTPDASVAIARALARRPDTAWIQLTSGGTELLCVADTDRDGYDALLFGKLPRTPSIVEVGALSFLHLFYGDAQGWYAKSGPLTRAQVAALRPPPHQGAPGTGPDGGHEPDPADTALLAALAGDGRASYPELHQATGRSESALKRRLEQLVRSGVLYFDVQFDAALLGYHVQAVLWLTVAPSALATVGEALAGHPETAFVAATTGTSNLVATVLCHDHAGLYAYLSEKIGALAGVRHVETAPVVRKFKQMTYEERI
jgi:DNA-binding Lrp family transcriptional regulator